MKSMIKILLSLVLIWSCQSKNNDLDKIVISPGAWQMDEYLPLLKGKNVGMVVNHTSTILENHLVDSLLKRDITIKAIFSPEHGFRGNEDAGKKIGNSIDEATGIPIISLYGKNRKPRPEDLEELDIVIFDIQDVGARFYTYISTMHVVMEACAENNKPMIILDRPNPTGDYVAGPVREPDQVSFVGMHPIPIIHGLTIGELAIMINGEGWLDSALQCDIQIIKNKNYTHKDRYVLPVNPSPNLPNIRSIRLYPSLCLFEGSSISIGRGTDFPFQVIGYPDSTFGEFSFTPISMPGMATHPKHENKLSFGEDFRSNDLADKFTIKYYIDYYQKVGDDSFFARPASFDRLAGTSKLRKQMMAGMSAEEIEESWQQDLNKYKVMRKKYLLYDDFE